MLSKKDFDEFHLFNTLTPEKAPYKGWWFDDTSASLRIKEIDRHSGEYEVSHLDHNGKEITKERYDDFQLLSLEDHFLW